MFCVAVGSCFVAGPIEALGIAAGVMVQNCADMSGVISQLAKHFDDA